MDDARPISTVAHNAGRLYSNKIEKTTRRKLTKRGVLWLGQTCNIRCHFCYFLDRINNKTHPEHAFMSIEKAKHICSELRYKYGNNAIDIQGGEPTIYKHIYDLVSHCYDIGLMPTLITNAVALADVEKVKKLKQAGVRDLLMSLQGIGENYDRIVGLPGGSVKQMKALVNIAEVGIPLRFNVVLSKTALPQLPEIANLAVTNNVRAVNFLAFNPFEDQANDGMRSSFNVPTYTDVSYWLVQALDILDAAGVEANVRYLPLCMVPERHRKSMYNFQQLSYDHHEWDYASWTWTGQQPQRMNGGSTTELPKLRDHTYERVHGFFHDNPELDTSEYIERDDEIYRDHAKIRAKDHCGYKHSDACQKCALKDICDGFHGDYTRIFTMNEATPITDIPPVTDPTHYIKQQQKIVEEQDWEWALGSSPD